MRAAPWFIAPQQLWREGQISLPPEESRHAVAVLRVTPPDVITITNGEGVVARCAVSKASEDRLEAEILEMSHHPPTRPALAVYQAVAKGTKLDGLVQQLAELGVTELVPFESSRAVTRWDDAKSARVSDRWTAIARSAAKQSRNPWVLEVGRKVTFAGLVERIGREPLVIALWEEAQLPLRTALHSDAPRVAVIVGPEGGLTEQETDELADAGALLVSLGPRILRTEHAAAATAAALSFHYGALG